MGITERLANLPIWAVLVTIVVLLVLRFVLMKQRTPVAKSIAEIAESLAVAMALVFLLIRPFVVQAFFIPSESMVPTLLTNDHIMVNKFIYRFTDPKRDDVVVFDAPPQATGGEKKDFIKRVIAVPGDVVRITPGYVLVGENQYNHQDLRNSLANYAGSANEIKVKLADKKVLVNDREVTKAEVASAMGEPNAKVKVVPGKVYINGKLLKEPFIAEDPDASYPNLQSTPEQDQKYMVQEKKDLAIKIPKGKMLVMGDNRNDSNDARFWGLLSRKRILGKAMFIFWPLNRIRWIH